MRNFGMARKDVEKTPWFMKNNEQSLPPSQTSPSTLKSPNRCLETPQIPPLIKASTKPKPQGISRRTYRERITLARMPGPGATRMGDAPFHSLHGSRRSLLLHHTELMWPHLQCSVTACATHITSVCFFHSFPLSVSITNLKFILKTVKSTDGKPRVSVLLFGGSFNILRAINVSTELSY